MDMDMNIARNHWGACHRGMCLIVAKQRAFTLVELMLVVVALALLTTMAMSSYQKFTDRARNAQAASDIREIDAMITRFYTQNSRYPDDLNEINVSKKDPWSSAYVYLNFSFEPLTKWRKDGGLQPINSDYDLYSKGKDKKSKPPISSGTGADDIVRGRNGNYIGLGKDYK
jgi:general secretion pathway protein G